MWLPASNASIPRSYRVDGLMPEASIPSGGVVQAVQETAIMMSRMRRCIRLCYGMSECCVTLPSATARYLSAVRGASSLRWVTNT